MPDAAGSRTRAAQIVNDYAATQLRRSEMEARMLFDGQRASRAGGAFAGGTTIDSFDAHDGHALIKGHAGVSSCCLGHCLRRERGPPTAPRRALPLFITSMRPASISGAAKGPRTGGGKSL